MRKLSLAASLCLCLLMPAWAQTGPHRKLYTAACVPTPASYVTSQILAFSVTTSTNIGGGVWTGSHTFSYTLGAGHSLLIGLVPDQLGWYSITDDGANTWTFPPNSYAVATALEQTGLATTSITITFQALSDITATATLLIGEYSIGALSNLGNVSPGGQVSPFTKTVVIPRTTPLSGVTIQEGYFGRPYVGIVTADNGFSNPGVSFTGPDAGFGGTQRQVINLYSKVGAPLISSYALVDNMSGTLGLSEVADASFLEADWTAFYYLCKP